MLFKSDVALYSHGLNLAVFSKNTNSLRQSAFYRNRGSKKLVAIKLFIRFMYFCTIVALLQWFLTFFAPWTAKLSKYTTSGKLRQIHYFGIHF